jgi:hypothetical protein
MAEIWCLKGGKGTVEARKDAKISYKYQKQYYWNVSAGGKMYAWHGLSEIF